MTGLIHYTKQYTSEQEQITLLKERGLLIEDEPKAVGYLENIGYYRLSGYMFPFLEQPKNTHRYKNGVSFEQIMQLYRFDKKLRILLFNEIEKVEIAIRKTIMSVPAQMTGDIYWLTNPQHFANPHTFSETKNAINK